MKTRTWLMLSASAFLFTIGLAAGAGCDAVDNAFDCQSVCSKYKSCFDNDYDVGKCRDNCRERSSNDDSVRQAADTCEDCIDGMSCTGAAFSCSGSCINIVP
jgi:hypothetical protein